MASYQSHRYHIIFSTKGREPFIVESIEKEVWAYLAKLGRDKGLKVYIVGGFDDHVHMYCGIPASMAVSDAVQELKGASSRWLKLHFENPDMGWQSQLRQLYDQCFLARAHKEIYPNATCPS